MTSEPNANLTQMLRVICLRNAKAAKRAIACVQHEIGETTFPVPLVMLDITSSHGVR